MPQRSPASVRDTSATAGVVAADPHVYRPLLPGRMRNLAVVGILLAILVIAVLGMRYSNQEAAGQLDRLLDAYIRSYFSRDQTLARGLISFADPPQVAILLSAVAGAAAIARRWAGVVLVIGGTLTAVTITEVILKPFVGRLRYGHLSFPSGHTAAIAAIAVATVILLIGAQRPRSIALRLLPSLVAVAVAAGVAVALIAQHVHYATDTVAGCCVALATVLTTALALDFLVPRVRSVLARISPA
jgi:membrane-associated phospholipid phosphatase